MAREQDSAVIRGLAAEESFKKLLGDNVVRSSKSEDCFDHWDLAIKFDVKKIKSVDEFGESNYHWVELANVNGNKGWLYGSADYFAFETKSYWIIVSSHKLRDFVSEKVINTEITTVKEPYRIYRRTHRMDKVVMLPTIDLCYLGFLTHK